MQTPACQVLAAGGTVADLLRLVATEHGTRVAVRSDDRTLTYRELWDRAAARSAGLVRAGVRHGDRVALWMVDEVDHVELYATCAVAGLVAVPCNSAYTAAEVARTLASSGARALIHSAAMSDRAAQLRESGDAPSVVLAVGSPEYQDLLVAGPGTPLRPPAAGDPYVIAYTSGTTGRPKGAVLTHHSVLEIARLNALSYRLPAHSIALVTGSMSFVSVVPAHVICHFGLAGTVVLPGSWTPSQLPSLVRTHRANFLYAPSPLVADIAEAFRSDRRSLDTVRTVLHSGSKAPAEALERLFRAVGNRLCEGWGMTENSGGLITTTRDEDFAEPDSIRRVLGSAGRAAPDTEVEVLAADGSPLPHDGVTVGELVFRSPAMIEEYWDDPASSAAALAGGWFHSGDLGAIDPEGYVVISDRRTDLIVSGGINVYPSEVEDCIRELTQVEDVGVVGLPHSRWGTAVVAAIVRRPNTDLDGDAVVAHCRSRLASFKKPTAVYFLDALPRTTSLKLSRIALREALLRDHEAVATAAVTDF